MVLLGILVASVLGKKIIRASKGTMRTGEDFNAILSFN